MIETRPAKVSEMETIKEIARRTVDKSYRSLLGDEGVDWYINSGECDKEMDKHTKNLHVITDDSKIVGFSIFFDDFIHLMMVDEKYHRKGYGERLLSYSENELFKSNKSIKLESLEGNTQANNFYLKNGWVIADKRKDDEQPFVRLMLEKRA